MISMYDNALPITWGHARSIPNYDRYLATDKGLIVSLIYKKPRSLSPSVKKNGRMTVNMWANGEHRTEYVHRLIALAFHGEPKTGQEVNHKDGNPGNCVPDNLEWCTRSENQSHAFQTGLNKPNIQAKLTRLQAEEIRDLKGHFTQQQLADRFEVSKSAIKHIHMNRTWIADDPIKYLGEHI